MLENNEMIYTAIFQNSQGALSYETYTGHMNRSDAWLSAAKQGGANDKCLIALVPGVHPVYFYSDFIENLSVKTAADEIKQHDVYAMGPDEVFEMT